MKKLTIVLLVLVACGARTDLSDTGDHDAGTQETCPNPVLSDRCDSREVGKTLCTLTVKTGAGQGTVFLCSTKGGNNTGWVPYELWVNDNPRCDAWCGR